MCHKNLYSKCDKLKSLHSYSNYNGRFPFDISLCLFHKSRILYNKHMTYFVYYFTFLLKTLRRKKTNHCWVFYRETFWNNCFTAVLCLVTQSCRTLGDLLNCRPQAPLSTGMLQARILEWVAMTSSRGSSQPKDQTQVSHIAGGFFTDWSTKFYSTHSQLDYLFSLAIILVTTFFNKELGSWKNY